MNESAANRKIKKFLMLAAVMINIWIPVDKRTQYLNYFYSLIVDTEKE